MGIAEDDISDADQHIVHCFSKIHILTSTLPQFWRHRRIYKDFKKAQTNGQCIWDPILTTDTGKYFQNLKTWGKLIFENYDF